MAKKVYILTIVIMIIAATSLIGNMVYDRFIKEAVIEGTYRDYVPAKKYDDDFSITYNKPYNELLKELKYARVLITNQKESGHQPIRKIEDKEKLIEIVREFDKLKGTIPKEEYPEPVDTGNYIITMWREGSSVTYIIVVHDGTYYYKELPYLLLRKMPKKLVELLGLE